MCAAAAVPGPALDVVLHGPSGPQPVGRPVPVRVEIRNTGPEELWAVGVLDGSEDALRFPHYRPSITLGNTVVAEPAPPEDPLVGPLRPDAFRRLRPGEGFDPTGPGFLPLLTFAGFVPRRPGRYRWTLTLSTKSARVEEWLGRFGQDECRAEALALLSRVPRLMVASAPLDIEVR
ncbi:hypothetical protein [Streptomyces sp. URMC 123]|uniref:hypothetical protein n=1 Tax=Streptomyces sp. URMC 123 TaxID=3423403 RepID=UPI003F1A65DB